VVYLKFNNRPLCDHMGCVAGIRFCEAVGVESCSYRTRREALAVLRRVNATDWAGALSIHAGECPHVADLESAR
jgi:hypothetical protein